MTNGSAILINASDINKMKDFRTWTHEKFRHMCILSGCDYLGSLHGVGLGKAKKALGLSLFCALFYHLYKGLKPSYWNGTHCLTSWKRFGKLVDAPKGGVSDEYIDGFTRANLIFLHQVYILVYIESCVARV